jgi:hypothetical protein
VLLYIIENANILKGERLTSCSILVTEDRITTVQGSLPHYRLMKMDVEPFFMTPTFVLLNSTIPTIRSFPEMKKCLVEQFLLKGCTTLFTYANIFYENELEEKINEVKTSLISCPIDFIIGVRIPARLITPNFIRNCKKNKVPAIFVELTNQDELEKIPWGWIREALFPFNCPLFPIISPTLKKEQKAVLSKWKGIMLKEKIPAHYEELIEDQPLAVPLLNKIGLYPQKASLMSGTELSYNLYLRGREIKKVDELHLFHYHGDRLAVTVHKGKVIRSAGNVLFKPGNGEHVKVRTPSYFSL